VLSDKLLEFYLAEIAFLGLKELFFFLDDVIQGLLLSIRLFRKYLGLDLLDLFICLLLFLGKL
jgi:hypothetical protein